MNSSTILASLRPVALRPVGLQPGERWRAAYAADPSASRGRLIPEESSPTRSEFQRDRDRIIHCTAFRRLKHKTQVFLEQEDDYYRTRLTHTLEVAQIARSIARALGLDEDLAETLALAHDLGHTPFGHAGERALHRAMADWGGFDHNAQSLKIVTQLERRYAAFDGLNLTWETLEGLVKHNGPLTDRAGLSLFPEPTPAVIMSYDSQHPLELWSQASAEAQAAAISDDIAYNAHDIDDGLRSGILTLEHLQEVPFLHDRLRDIQVKWPSLEPVRIAHELQRRIITSLVEDAIGESVARLGAAAPRSADDIRALTIPVVTFSEGMTGHVKSLRAFLFPKLYRNQRIMIDIRLAEERVEQMFHRFMQAPELLPGEWAFELSNTDLQLRAARIGDFIAGMTDRYAIETYRRLFDGAKELL